MAYSVTLSDGTKLDNLALNGNNFVSALEVTEDTFKGKLSKVTIVDEDGKSTEHGEMELIQAAHYSDGYYFILADKQVTAEDQLQKAVADLTSMVMALTAAQATFATSTATK